jgi:hypothetical protein
MRQAVVQPPVVLSGEPTSASLFTHQATASPIRTIHRQQKINPTSTAAMAPLSETLETLYKDFRSLYLIIRFNVISECVLWRLLTNAQVLSVQAA